MKKLSLFLLALLALFSLSACKDTEDDKTAGSEVVTEGEQTTGGEEVSEPESEPAPIEYKEMKKMYMQYIKFQALRLLVVPVGKLKLM